MSRCRATGDQFVDVEDDRFEEAIQVIRSLMGEIVTVPFGSVAARCLPSVL